MMGFLDWRDQQTRLGSSSGAQREDVKAGRASHGISRGEIRVRSLTRATPLDYALGDEKQIYYCLRQPPSSTT